MFVLFAVEGRFCRVDADGNAGRHGIYFGINLGGHCRSGCPKRWYKVKPASEVDSSR